MNVISPGVASADLRGADSSEGMAAPYRVCFHIAGEFLRKQKQNPTLEYAYWEQRGTA